jgi:hypothetical protein
MDTKYIMFDLSEAGKINFNEVMETSVDTLRVSNTDKTFVKYVGDIPASVQSLETKSEEYNKQEILDILSTEDWLIVSGSIISDHNN